jgi:large subunit ribosomal protein L16
MNIKPGRILYEVGGVSDELGREALYRASQKLPFKCKIVTAEAENEIY